MKIKLIIFGIGGNCIDIIDTLNDINELEGKCVYECVGFLDDDRQSWGKEYYGAKVLGPLDSAPNYRDCRFVNGIGSPFNFWRKRDIISKSQIPLESFETIIHPSASVSKLSSLGFGTVILQNVSVTSNIIIGNHVIILPNSVISHDNIIGDYSCIAAGVCISSHVNVGESCYLGSNSTIIGNVSLGKHCLIGMGSVVLDDVARNSVVAGNPAKFIKETVK